MGRKLRPMSMKSVKERLIRTLILAAIGVCIGAIVASFGFLTDKNKNSPAILNVAGVGGPWQLVGQDGKTRTDQDFKNKYKLIYFGFTYCPAICPTELQKTAEAYNELSSRLQDQIQMIFVTIDPERDTQEVMKNYVALFHPDLLGLTGTKDQIDAIKREYKVYGAKVPEGDSYTMDHSSYIYFMSPKDELIALYKAEQTAEEMEESIRAYLKKNPA